MRKPELPERLYLDFDSFFASAEQQMNLLCRAGRLVWCLMPVSLPA